MPTPVGWLPAYMRANLFVPFGMAGGIYGQSSIGIHFGLIDNAGESDDAPVNDLIAARRAHGVDAANFVAPHYGQVFRY
jgi:hypothetical protein